MSTGTGCALRRRGAVRESRGLLGRLHRRFDGRRTARRLGPACAAALSARVAEAQTRIAARGDAP